MAGKQAFEDYLEAIYILEQKDELIKSVRIAERLGVSRPAVNQAMKALIDIGYVEKPDYADITLTEKGRAIAITVLQRHTLIKDILLLIGVDENTAEIDACKIEHNLSDVTVKKLFEYFKK